MSKLGTTFQSVSYGPYSRTGVTCVAILGAMNNIFNIGWSHVHLCCLHWLAKEYNIM